MNLESTEKIPPAGHVAIPTLAIGVLSIALVAGLSLLGIVGRVDAALSDLVSQEGMDGFPKAVPGWLVWLAALVFAFGIPGAILCTAGNWRRIMLWVTALVLVAGWVPVLSLAARDPEVGAPWIATCWAGICALVYARNHRMTCDGPADESSSEISP